MSARRLMPLRAGGYRMRPRIGLSVMPLETRCEAIIGLATEGDRLGYDGFFLPETWAYDTTVLLAEAAARTTRITLGTGILGIWNRSAATIAMAAATLHSMSGGRFALGLGASTPQLAEGLHDTPFEPPVPRMRRMVTQIRALLRGERIPLAVTASARALKLNVPPAPALPIHVAALGDAMTGLAANAPKFTGVIPADAEELLEQLIVYGTPPEARRRLGRWHEAGADSPVLLLRPNLAPEERALTLEAFRPMLQSI